MNTYLIIIALGVLIFSSHLFNQLFDRTRIPNVLLLLLIGILIGPVGGIVTTDFFGKLGEVFTTITLVIILFESGSGLRLKDIRDTIASSLLLTVLNFILTMGITMLIATAFTPLGWVQSAFVGAIIGGTSSAVVIPMVQQLKLGQRSASLLILESAISDVLCLVVGLALLNGLSEGLVSLSAVFNKIWKSFLFAILLGMVAGLIWSFFISRIRSIKNSMFTTLAFVFVVYGLIEMYGFNGGIAVLGFGIILGNAELFGFIPRLGERMVNHFSGFNDNERNFFAEIVFVMQTYFFVYVGISLQFGSAGIYLVGLLLVVLIMAFRQFSIRLFTHKSMTALEKGVLSVMTPKGLVPAILASIPMQRALSGGEVIMDLGYSVVLFSILFSSLLVILLGRNPDLLERKKNDSLPPP
ncbi:MAG TPA: hypothetical protein ENN63_01905 [Bacteroidetes bacterium]|nr:hypothetical protein [Bacteroidota bacterium]